MPKEPLLWFDLTTTFQWTRPPVGIVRAEQECCRWLLTKLPDRVRICIFDQALGKLLELQRREAWAILNRDWGAPESAAILEVGESPQPTAVASPPAGLAGRLEALLRKLALTTLAAAPKRYQPGIRRHLVAVRRAMAFGYHRWAAVRGAIRTSMTTARVDAAPSPDVVDEALALPIAEFARGDRYLTMGLDWDHNKMEFLYRERKRSGVTVFNFAYDIIPVKFPHFYQSGKFELFAAYFATMAWTADQIICISQCTARDLSAFFEDIGSPSPPMTVVRLGDSLPRIGVRNLSPSLADLRAAPYLLFVSTIEIRKNHETIYKAYVRLLEGGFDVPKLVLVGMLGWRVDDLLYSLRNDPRVRDKIIILDRVTDSELDALYEGCMFTLYPSLYEGWGLPVAESLAHGKFCLASNAASIPEIAKDLIDYVDPWDVHEWARKIQVYCSDTAALHERERLISSRYRITSWETTADQICTAIFGDELSPKQSVTITLVAATSSS